IPLAKAMGLYVITNGNGRNAERVLALGTDEFIDYRKDDYAQKLKNIDYVIDTLGGRETAKQLQILKNGGKLVSLKGP
ncbi:zinc-binding dehydrogenase, partial [Faecalibacterium prausnitzii]